jgi:hypothetical protein
MGSSRNERTSFPMVIQFVRKIQDLLRIISYRCEESRGLLERKYEKDASRRRRRPSYSKMRPVSRTGANVLSRDFDPRAVGRSYDSFIETVAGGSRL